MEKKLVNFRLSPELIEQLEELSTKTGKTKTDLVEQALKCLFRQENQIKEEIELYQKENEQLKIALQILKERELSLEELKNTYERFLLEKDKRLDDLQKRIEELKERIEELKQKQGKKRFWKFWK